MIIEVIGIQIKLCIYELVGVQVKITGRKGADK